MSRIKCEDKTNKNKSKWKYIENANAILFENEIFINVKSKKKNHVKLAYPLWF